MTIATTIAGAAGRITGAAARGLLWSYRTIDWAEVAEIVLHGLQILIVLTLLAGRATRRAWDALPVLSERLGRWYARLLVGATTAAPAPAPKPCIISIRQELEQLSCRQIRHRYGIRRKLAKQQLIDLALAA